MKECKHPGFAKADAVVMKIFRYMSYPPAVLLMIVALIATINVITSKTIKWIIPSNIDWITYLLIPIVFLSLAHVQLDRGLVVVDFICTKYPKWLQNAISIISNILLIAMNGFLGWRGLVLAASKFATHEMSSTDPGNFYMWPFPFILGFGMICFAFTSFWCILRTVFDYQPAPPVDPSQSAEALEAEKAYNSDGGDEK